MPVRLLCLLQRNVVQLHDARHPEESQQPCASKLHARWHRMHLGTDDRPRKLVKVCVLQYLRSVPYRWYVTGMNNLNICHTIYLSSTMTALPPNYNQTAAAYKNCVQNCVPSCDDYLEISTAVASTMMPSPDKLVVAEIAISQMTNTTLSSPDMILVDIFYPTLGCDWLYSFLNFFLNSVQCCLCILHVED